MNFSGVAGDLGLGSGYSRWETGFQKSEGLADQIGRWLSSETELRRDCEFVGFDAGITEAVLRSARTVSESPPLVRLIAHIHHILFEKNDVSMQTNAGLPMLPDALGEMSDMFYVFVFLSGIPKAVENHQHRKIPQEVTAQTLSDLQTWVVAYHAKTGRWGLDLRGWLTNHFHGRLIALGRLQFQLCPYGGSFKVYVHRHENRSIALALPGQQFRPDGQFANADYGMASESWCSQWHETDDSVTGHPVLPGRGTVDKEPLTLDLKEWKVALQTGDHVLEIHIPASGPLDREACRASISRCADFFRTHYPEIPPFRAWTCTTWFLDPQLAGCLSASSNIATFQSLFHLLPAPYANDSQMFERVFGNEKNLDKLPANTSLQRALIAHMRAGKRWRNGAGYILP